VYRPSAVRPLVRDTLHLCLPIVSWTVSEPKRHGCMFCVQFGNHVTQNQSPFIDRRPSKSVTTVRLRLYYTEVLNGLHKWSLVCHLSNSCSPNEYVCVLVTVFRINNVCLHKHQFFVMETALPGSYELSLNICCTKYVFQRGKQVILVWEFEFVWNERSAPARRDSVKLEDCLSLIRDPIRDLPGINL
jgi:hypothetical protein